MMCGVVSLLVSFCIRSQTSTASTKMEMAAGTKWWVFCRLVFSVFTMESSLMVQGSHNFLVETKNVTGTRDSDQVYFTPLAWFKTHGGAGGDVQAQAIGRGTVKIQRGIGFGEMVVAANLNGAVAGVGHHERGNLRTVVQRQLTACRDQFTGDHFRFHAKSPSAPTTMVPTNRGNQAGSVLWGCRCAPEWESAGLARVAAIAEIAKRCIRWLL
mmetsp:Transcript_23524/g.41535  ORF Transcript_23524/g.41535 Transcript_23524/m.41535 type:complete len:213 (+) Transcript_23524:432-1070(+)